MNLVDILASRAEKDAAGIVSVYALMNIDNISFVNHISNGNGSAMLIKSKSAAFISNSLFVGNNSAINGGSINLSESMAQISDSKFFNNYAVRGHAIDISSNSYLFVSRNI